MENKNTLICTKETIANLKNASLRKSLTTMLTASKSSRTALWKYAKAVSDIINGETFVDDFESQTAFAKFVDLSKSTITNYVKAVEFVERNDIKEYFGEELSNLSVGKAYILSTLEAEDLKDFMDFAKTETLDIINISDRALKDILKYLYYESEHTEDAEKNNAIEASESGTQEESDGTDSKESTEKEKEPLSAPTILATFDETGKNIVLTINGNTFRKERIIALDDDILEAIKADFEES